MPKREAIGWTPEWTKEYQGWTAAFMAKNAWRCDRMHSVEDLVQEGFLVFFNLTTKYPRVTEPKHFFALYKRSIINKINDMASHKRRRQHAEPVALPSDVSEFFIGRIGEVSNAGYVGAILNEMPEELQLVLNRLCKHGAPSASKEKHENLSMRLSRLLGISNNDHMAQLKEVLSNVN